MALRLVRLLEIFDNYWSWIWNLKVGSHHLRKYSAESILVQIANAGLRVVLEYNIHEIVWLDSECRSYYHVAVHNRFSSFICKLNGELP